ncbi:hypothetical protein ILUMI_21953 [Ignelater luminosus]|uniref:Putative alpha-L-fucosidase n=1 Tax=Ignelater luminosus TaxID=2038154 RepID=A0A8K0G3D1_IGNLU|nr:hypothetical protein ILUMI_21953 [Ignelater luminosus]
MTNPTLAIIVLILCTFSNGAKYKPNWNSLQTRPIPKWYDQAKIGIFIHWGVYSVPSFGSEWFWKHWKDGTDGYKDFMKQNYPPNFTYQDFGRYFTAEFFKPDEWAKQFKKSGAEYVILTTKHHEGFTMWPSTYSFGWNAMDIGPNRDIVAELSTAVRAQNLKFGAYYSLLEWYNPRYLADSNANFTTNNFVADKMYPELLELIETYKPDIIWADGEWTAPDTYWNSTNFLAWLYNESPVKDAVVADDRWGKGSLCKHGGVFTCQDGYNPKTLQKHKFENAVSLDKHSWGFRRNARLEDILSIEELITEVVQTVSCGGNIAINVGPTHYGKIPLIFQQRLSDLGSWLNVNGQSIKKTTPWKYQNDTLNSNVWYTQAKPAVYAISLKWPENNIVELGAVKELFGKHKPKVNLLGVKDQLTYKVTKKTVKITLPDKATVKSKWAYVLKIA